MKYKICISYNGGRYSGFQSQKNGESIQGVLETTLSRVLVENIKIYGSGRTDAGVSALEQVCHFECCQTIDNCIKVRNYANSILPRDIRILSIESVDEQFHARFSAKSKMYEYYFYLSKVAIPVYDNFALQIDYDVNIDNMCKACEIFVGKHDFTSFCASGSSADNKIRVIDNAQILQVDDRLYKFVISGNGFLYNMVRIIVGTLIDVGRGKINYKDINEILLAKDRQKAGKTVEGKGLYLKKVIY